MWRQRFDRVQAERKKERESEKDWGLLHIYVLESKRFVYNREMVRYRVFESVPVCCSVEVIVGSRSASCCVGALGCGSHEGWGKGWAEEVVGRVTVERSPLGSPDASLLRSRVWYVCVCVFTRKKDWESGCTHIHTCVSLNAQNLLIQQPPLSSPSLPSTPLLFMAEHAGHLLSCWI